MVFKVVYLGILATLSSITLAGEVRLKRQTEAVDDRKVVCYYANWAVYRQGNAQFTPQNINPYLCTHLIYAFGGLGINDTIQPFDNYQDIEKGGYGRFAALKTYNKDLKTMLAIGGWNEGSKRFSPLVEDPGRRRNLIRSAITFLRRYNFDGIDWDWEYPTLRAGGRPQDRDNYARLIQEMREAFKAEAKTTGKDRLLISMAVPASLEYAGKGYAIEALNQNLDFFNLLTYDYHSSQEPAVNHHAPLFRPDSWSEFDFRKDLNIDATIKFYLSKGASRHKLVLGIPTYGRSYTLANPDAHEIGSPTTGPGKQGAGTKEDGYLAYYEICQNVLEEGWSIQTPFPGVMGPYAYKDDQWVGFDNVDIAVEKAFYVAEEGLGGIMFWTIDNDDFRGTCSKTPYPIIESAKEAMFSIESEIKTKTSVSVSTSEQTSVTRLRLTPEELAKLAESSEKTSSKPSRPSVLSRPQQVPDLNGLLRSGGSTTTTPAPPTTPSSGPAFECKNEGFFPHPGSCKKYYWCLDAAALGTVAHTFTCPRGLYFNRLTDGCDFRRNVDCGDKDDKEPEIENEVEGDNPEDNAIEDNPEDSVEDPKSLKEILEIVKAAGGVEGLEKKIEEEEEQKKGEEERRINISTKTKNRLSSLLNKAKSAATTPSTTTDEEEKSPSPVSIKSSLTSSGASRQSLLNRLASRRRNSATPRQLPAPKQLPTPAILADSTVPDTSSSPPSSTQPESPTTRSSSTSSSSSSSAVNIRSQLFRNRSRFDPSAGSSSSRSSSAESRSTSNSSPVQSSSVPNIRSRFRNLFSSRNSPTTTPTTTVPPTSSSPPANPNDPESDPTSPPDSGDEGQRIQIIGAHIEEEDEDSSTFRLGLFKPKEGVREKLRETLATVLEDEESKRGSDGLSRDNDATIAPFNAPTITKNTRIETLLQSRSRDSGRSFASSRERVNTEEELERNRFVTVQRGVATTPSSPPSSEAEDSDLSEENQVPVVVGGEELSNEGNSESGGFRPTPPDSQISREETTPAPPVPTTADQITDRPVIADTTNSPRANNEILELEDDILTTLDESDVTTSTFRSQFEEERREEEEEEEEERRGAQVERQRQFARPLTSTANGRASSRARRPSFRAPPTATAAPAFSHVETPRRQTPRKLEVFNLEQPVANTLDTPNRDQSLSIVQNLFRDVQEEIQGGGDDRILPQPPHLQQPVASTSFRGRPLIPVAPSGPALPVPNSGSTRSFSRAPTQAPALSASPSVTNSGSSAYEYEYYYDYVDDDDSAHSSDYDLVPLSTKVKILESGQPHCLDVGVFPHPFSCKKFVNCFRNPGTGIVGSVYKCPSYLAFDPVGGRCNWVNEIVCAPGTTGPEEN